MTPVGQLGHVNGGAAIKYWDHLDRARQVLPRRIRWNVHGNSWRNEGTPTLITTHLAVRLRVHSCVLIRYLAGNSECGDSGPTVRLGVSMHAEWENKEL